MNESAELTKKAYDLHGVKYTIYRGTNSFYGTPVPRGYEAILELDPKGILPPYLSLKKKEE